MQLHSSTAPQWQIVSAHASRRQQARRNACAGVLGAHFTCSLLAFASTNVQILTRCSAALHLCAFASTKVQILTRCSAALHLCACHGVFKCVKAVAACPPPPAERDTPPPAAMMPHIGDSNGLAKQEFKQVRVVAASYTSSSRAHTLVA